jgi:hypothetical protein
VNKKHTKYLTISLIAIIVIMTLSLPFFLGKSRLASAVNKLYKEGFPVSPQGFADKYYKAIPAEQNGANDFNDAYKLLENPENDYRLIVRGLVRNPRLDQKLAPELLAEVKKDVRANLEFFDEMEKIKKYNLIHFNYNWKAGHNMMLSDTSKFRAVARAYSLKTEFAISNNDSQQASKLLRKMFHVSYLASQEPTLFGQLIFYACDAIVIRSLERCMNTISFSSEDLKFFDSLFDKNEELIVKQWPKVWWKELVFSLTIINFNKFDSYLFSKTAINEGFPLIIFYYYTGITHNDLVEQIKLTKKIVKTPLDIYAKRKLKLEKIENESEKLNSVSMFSSTSLCENSYRKALDTIARLRCAKTACAVERFRLKYARLPEKLNQLVPEFLEKVPMDPFDGKDLRYFKGSFDIKYEIPIIPVKDKEIKDITRPSRDMKYKTVIANKKGFYIYSVNKDLIDDKGDLLTIYNYRKKDITFIVIDKNRKLNE